MTRLLLAAALGAGLLATAAPAANACTIDTCPYLRPVCGAGVVDCYDIAHFNGCVDTAVRRVCVPDRLPPIT